MDRWPKRYLGPCNLIKPNLRSVLFFVFQKGNDSTENNEKEIKDLKTQLEQQKAENQDLINGLLDMNNALHDLKTLLTTQKTKIEEKDAEIQEKEVKLCEKDVKIQEKDAKILEKEVRIQVKDTIIKEKNSKIKEKDEALKINEYKISYLTYLIEIQSQKVAEIKKGPPAPPTEWLVKLGITIF